MTDLFLLITFIMQWKMQCSRKQFEGSCHKCPFEVHFAHRSSVSSLGKCSLVSDDESQGVCYKAMLQC
jgi:hypothetical protein